MSRVHLKKDNWELELEGEESFVERHLERLLPWLAVAGETDSPPEGGSMSVPPVLQVHKQISLLDFFALKAPRSILDRWLVCAYFFERYENRSFYDPGELEAFYHANFPEDEWDSLAWEEALSRGFLVKEPRGLTLSFSGQAYVQNGLV